MSVVAGITVNPERAALARFQDLFEVLEDLIKRVADSEDPGIRHKRAAVRAKLIQLESDTTPICRWVRSAPPARRRDPSWGRPALAALTSAAVALTLLTDS